MNKTYKSKRFAWQCSTPPPPCPEHTTSYFGSMIATLWYQIKIYSLAPIKEETHIDRDTLWIVTQSATHKWHSCKKYHSSVIPFFHPHHSLVAVCCSQNSWIYKGKSRWIIQNRFGKKHFRYPSQDSLGLIGFVRQITIVCFYISSKKWTNWLFAEKVFGYHRCPHNNESEKRIQKLNMEKTNFYFHIFTVSY
jgi:hypothetical protein